MILCREEDCFLFVYRVNSFSLDKGQRVLPLSMSNSGLVNTPSCTPRCQLHWVYFLLNTYIIGGPQSFKFQVALEAVPQIRLKLIGQVWHAFKLRVRQQRAHRLQVLITANIQAALIWFLNTRW